MKIVVDLGLHLVAQLERKLAEIGAEGHARGGNTHAWVQVYLPGCGWVDFDPSSGIVGNRGLVRAAVARDPRQAIPLSGVWIGSPCDNLGMTVTVSVTAAEEEALERGKTHDLSATMRSARTSG